MMALLRVFYEPEKLFPELPKKGAWRLPFIAALLVALITSVALVNMVGMQTMARNQIESMPRVAEQLGPQGVEQRVRDSDTPARKAMAYVMAPVGTAVVLLILAGLTVGLLHVFDAPIPFSQVFAVCSYATFAVGLVGAIGAIAVLAMLTDYTGIEMDNLLKLNPTIFLDKATGSKPLYSVASSLDLLNFWRIFLTALGLAKVSGALKLGKALVVVCIPWVLWIVVKAGLASLF